MTQLDADRGPARFCHTPMLEFSVSSLKHVMDGDGVRQHFLSLACNISDNPLGESLVVVMLVSWVVGKLVLALRPLIKIAAWSYALAASSAVSNVPNQIRLFLHAIKPEID